ncbi:kelch-like protein 17 [Planococcus citri]|uniref:kelch-like protein 17 n=1 Tax=Planococcus citri TaxID=170843 RepID=UPI0031F94B7D
MKLDFLVTESEESPRPEPVLSHKDYFFLHLNELRLQNSLCDVCFSVNGKTFSCHRVVLATVSPYFRTMFNGNFKESKSDLIPIHDVESEAFEEILNAVYTAQIHLNAGNAYCILKASHMMQLETIRNVCTSYISNNLKISYLVDTCLFALNIKKMELHSKCVQAISEDILTYGQTESFEKIPIDVFKSILSSRTFNDSEEEGVFLLISQWCKDNKVKSNDIQMLLESADLKMTKNIRSFIVADLMANSIFNGSTLNEKCIKVAKKSDDDSHLNLNVYFNGIDVKTCEKGWGVLKMSDEFDTYALSSFYPSESTFKKVTRIGSKMFCLESTGSKFQFSSYNEEGDKTALKVPPFHFKLYDMVAVDSTLYVMKKDRDSKNAIQGLLAYDCGRNVWETKFISFQAFKPSTTSETNAFGIQHPFSFPEFNFSDYNCSALTSSDGVLYLVASRLGESNQYLTLLDFRVPSVQAQVMGLVKFEQEKHTNAAICAFDKKIALSGSNNQGALRNTFSIFDTTAKRWLYDVKPMNLARADHNLIHRNGFIYAVENNLPFVTNEKYDLKSNKWITIPTLPRRVAYECEDGIVSVSTGSVFGIDV